MTQMVLDTLVFFQILYMFEHLGRSIEFVKELNELQEILHEEDEVGSKLRKRTSDLVNT